MTSGRRHMARRRTIQVLYQWDLTGQSSTEIKDELHFEQDIREFDIEYFQHLIRNIPTHVEAIDSVLSQCLDRDLITVDPVERAILRLGVYELRFRPEIPPRVVLNEAIEMSRVFGAEKGYRFVNGVLDRCQAVCNDSELPAAPAGVI